MSSAVARLLVFFTSAAVLVLEILAGRLLAPYVGVTLETFTGIIGTVLAGIAIGAWMGGRAADRHPPERLLGPLLIIGGILTLLAPTIVTWAGDSLRGGDPLSIVALTAVGFFLPAVVLSAVTPVVVKIRLQSLAETGAVVGGYSAVGTAGAIFGTFVTGFVLLAAWPSRPIVVVVGFSLVATGLVLAFRASSLTRPAAAVLVIAALSSAGLTAAVAGPCEVETAYFCARVTVDPDRPSGRILWLDTLRHSYVDVEDPTYLEFRYAELFSDVILTTAPEGPLDAIYVGGGGFTLPRWLTAVRPGSTNTVMELDDALVDIAVRDLGLDTAEIDEIAVGDARLTLGTMPLGTFELAVGDAFGGESVPWHLTTREFLSDLRRHMTDDGVYVMNLIDYPPAGFARAEAATLGDVFTNVVVIAPPDYFYGDRGGNYVLTASDAPIDAEVLQVAIRARGSSELVLDGAELDEWLDGAEPLVDDYAPVDQLISRDADR
jgi:MFS family permease